MADKFTLEEVFEAYYKCRKNKRNTCNALLFEQDYMGKCVQLHRELSEGTYKIGRSVAFLVTRPKLREVFAADFRDRIVHHLVVSRLESLFEEHFIQDNYNCRKEKGTLYGIKRLHGFIKECSKEYTEKDCWVLKCDIEGFFMAIHKPTLWQMLERFIKERYMGEDVNQLLWLTKMIALHSPEKNCVIKGDRKVWDRLPRNKSLFTCGDDYGLPIGNLTSQMFANFYLSFFDRKMWQRFKAYGRYVDDFFVVGKHDDLIKALPVIRKELKEVGLTLHPRKVYLQHHSKGVKFTGAVSKRQRLYAGNRTVENFISAVENYKPPDKKNISVLCEEDLPLFVGRINSYLGFLRHYNSYGIRRKVLRKVNKGWWKYIYISDHHRKVSIKKKYKHII